MNILITGVSSGIGLSLAHQYLNQGATVFGLSRREPPHLKGQSGFHFVSLDISHLNEIKPALLNLLAGVNELDVVILNAAQLGSIGDMADTPIEALKTLMDVNVWANKPMLDTLFESGLSVKQVVAISSGAALNGSRGWNGYAISKAALNMLIQLYAAERPETHFASLAPGLVDTAMQEAIRSLPFDPRFVTVERLKKAQGTENMPFPDTLAKTLTTVINRLMNLKNGSFFDIRNFPKI